MNTHYPRSFAALALAGVLVIGCGGGGVNPENVLAPKVRVKQVTVKGIGLEGGRLGVVLAIFNPNQFALPGTGVTATLSLNGTRFGDMSMNDSYTLAQGDTTLVTVPLDFQWTGVGGAASGILGYGTVDYGIQGTLSLLPSPSQHLQLPFNASGSVPIVKALSGSSY